MHLLEHPQKVKTQSKIAGKAKNITNVVGNLKEIHSVSTLLPPAFLCFTKSDIGYLSYIPYTPDKLE